MAKHRNITKAALIIGGLLLTAYPAFAFDSPSPRTAGEVADCVIREYAYYRHQVGLVYGVHENHEKEPELMSKAIATAVATKCAVRIAESH